MTKKDFELIAEVLRTSLALQRDADIRERLANEFADELSKTNPRFDRSRFVSACVGEDSTDSAGRLVRYPQRVPVGPPDDFSPWLNDTDPGTHE